MNVKYKPCCNTRCCVHGCELKDSGACICICSLADTIHRLKSVIEGKMLYDGKGFQYIPDHDFRQKVYNSWSEDEKEKFQTFKNFTARNLIDQYEKQLKSFEINDTPEPKKIQ